MFLYVVTHLLNHALGLVSLRVLEAGRIWFVAIWHNPLGQLVLYGALFAHFLLALWSLYRRRALKLSPWEWTQWGLGALIVPLGALHVVGTRLAHALYGVEPGYPWVLGSLVVSDWWGIARQFTLPVVVWLHACIGLHFAWRLRPWYRTWLPLLYAFALLVPVAGIAGAGIAVRDVAELAQQPGFLRELFVRVHVPSPAGVERLYAISNQLQAAALALLVGVLAARPLRDLWQRRRGVVCLDYGERRIVEQPAGLTVLEMSRIAGIPHASVCGGRGRCSTCRVRIGGAERAHLPPPRPRSRRCWRGSARRPMSGLLASSGRRRWLPRHSAAAGRRRAGRGLSAGYRRPMAASASRDPVRRHPRLHRDLGRQAALRRGFPAQPLFPRHRPGDGGGGRPLDKFIGDGVMAIFGLAAAPAGPAARRSTRRGAWREALEDLNEALSGDLELPLRIGIGLHAGPSIVGEMGYERATQLTAIGDTVNIASRLESHDQGIRRRAGGLAGGARARRRGTAGLSEPRRRDPRSPGTARGPRRQACPGARTPKPAQPTRQLTAMS